MGFLSSVKVPTSSAPPASSGIPNTKSAFLGGIKLPTAEQGAEATKLQGLAGDQQVAQAQAAHANSIPGIAQNTYEAATAPFIQGFNDEASQEKAKSYNPITMAQNGAKAVEDSFMGSLTDAGDKVYNASQVLTDHHASLLAKGASVGEAALGVLSPIFSAATAPLTYATAIPGIGQVADKVNETFAALGSGAGAHVATATVDDNPFLSEKTKATIRPLVHDTAALVAQLIAGKVGGDAVGKITANNKAILTAVKEDVAANPPSANPQFKAQIENPEGTLTGALNATAEKKLPVFGDTTLRPLKVVDQSEFHQIPFSNDYTDQANLPAIQAGRGGNGLPIVRYAEPKEVVPAGLKYEPVVPSEAPVQPTGSFLKGVSRPAESADTLYHGADAATAESIRANGFQPSKDFPGNGMVSLTADAAEAGNYAHLNGADGEVLPVKITGKNTKVYESMSDYTNALEKAKGETAGEKETNLNKGVDVVRIKEPGQRDVVFANPEAIKVADEGSVARPLKPVGTGETVRSRLAANVEANAIEKKLTNSLGNTPEYSQVSMKDQALRAADLIAGDPARAMRIALGKEMPPEGLLPEAVFTAVEDRAVKAGDVATLRRLAQESSLSTEATAMGQRIRALGERDQDSPVTLIQDVNKARTEAFEKKSGTTIKKATRDTVGEIKKEIKKNTSKRESWEDFMTNLTCNI